MTSKATRLTNVDTKRREKVNRALAEARALRPTQVVVWYGNADGKTGVLISEGTDRVRAIGGLTAAAFDVWTE